MEKAQLHHVFVGQRQREAVAKFLEGGVVQLLLLVRAHLALAPQPHAVAFFGLGEDHRGLARVLRRGPVRGIDLHRVVAAAAQPVDVGIAHVRDDLAQLGVLVEEMLAVEAAVGRGIGLEFAVDRFMQALEQHAVFIAREERVPVRAPQQLDHVPAGAGEQAFELLHDRAVAAHRAIQALQVAVDDKDQVVEAVARRERQPGERLGLVHFAVADEGPQLAAGGLLDAAVLEIPHEARLVDRAQGPEAHRAGRELPELRHQIRMAIGTKATAAGFLPIVIQPFFAQSPFKKSARIDPGGGVRLEVHQVAVAPAAEEMVEADFEQIGRRRVAGDVAAELGMRAVGAHHHGKRVPAHDRRDALLELEVAGKRRLVGKRDRVLVRRVEHRRQRHAPRARMVEQLAQQESRALAALGLHQRVEGVEPFARLGRVGVRRVDAPECGQVGHRGIVARPGWHLVLFIDIMPPAGYRAANLYPSPAAKSVVRSGRQFP